MDETVILVHYNRDIYIHRINEFTLNVIYIRIANIPIIFSSVLIHAFSR